MPATRLTSTPIDVGRFDVFGMDSQQSPMFVAHIGLAVSAYRQFKSGDSAALVHMQPPFASGRSFEPQVLGCAPLTVDEENRINIFVDGLLDEYEAGQVRRAKQYVIAPHAKPFREADGTIVYWRYSCAGFVVEAYRSVELTIIATAATELPPVSLKSICAAYPFAENYRKTWDDWGITGDGPWPVLLPGHVLHSLNRPAEEIRQVPYVAKDGDEVFPN